MGSSLAHQTSKKNCLISAYAGMPCTTCVKGRVGQVWACPDASGRLYDCGNTGQNTDLLEIEYPKNSLLKPDKWAPAPPGDWHTRGQVRSVTACCKHAWHFQVYISSHGTHLHVNHAFWFAPSSHTVCLLALGSTRRAFQNRKRRWQKPVTRERHKEACQWMDSFSLNPCKG
jgi:hypothetical protein